MPLQPKMRWQGEKKIVQQSVDLFATPLDIALNVSFKKLILFILMFKLFSFFIEPNIRMRK
jgi:hypothetical protein